MKNILASVLVTLLLNLVCFTSTPANPKADKDAQVAAKVKAAIFKLGTGPAAYVEVKLRDGARLKGYVAEAVDDHFVVVEEKGGAWRDVPYPQVKRVKGNNLSTGVTIAIVAGITMLVIGLIFGRLD